MKTVNDGSLGSSLTTVFHWMKLARENRTDTIGATNAMFYWRGLKFMTDYTQMRLILPRGRILQYISRDWGNKKHLPQKSLILSFDLRFFFFFWNQIFFLPIFSWNCSRNFSGDFINQIIQFVEIILLDLLVQRMLNFWVNFMLTVLHIKWFSI